MKNVSILVSAAVALATSSTLLAQQPGAQEKQDQTGVGKPKSAPPHESDRVKNWLSMCIGCHGIPDYRTAYPVVYRVPMIAGQSPGYIVAALKAYRSGERPNPTMRGIAMSLTDEDIGALAAYYGGAGAGGK